MEAKSCKRRRWRLAAVFALSLAAFAAQAEELRVACSGGFAEALRALGPAYEARTGVKVTLIFGPSMGQTPDAIPNRLARGEPIDVLVMVGSALDDLGKAGKVDPATKVTLARSLIAAAVKSGAPRPDISTIDALRKTLLDTRSIAVSESASGVYLSTVLFERLGIGPAMKDKTRRFPGEPVGRTVARGEVELGFQQLSELKAVAGIDIIGLLPEAAQLVTEFSAARVSASANPSAARAFIEYLASPAAAPAVKETGLDPVAGPGR